MTLNTKLSYLLVALIAVAIGFMAAKAFRSNHAEPTQVIAETRIKAPVLTLPEFSLKNRAGELQSIRSWPGKSLVINFWATWCAPCRREIPLLKDLQQHHAATGTQVIGIAVDFRDEVLKYADAMQMDYPLLIGEQDGLNAVDAFGIEAVGLPYTVFTDAKGNIIATHIGELHKPQAELILATVEKVNQGGLAPAAARTQIIAALSNLPATVASDEPER